MGVLETVKKSFASLHANVQFIIILFGANLIVNFLSFPFSQLGPGGEGAANISPAAIALGLLVVLIGIFIQGGTLATARNVIQANSVSLPDFTKAGTQYYLKLLGLGAITFGVIVAGLLVIGAFIGISAIFGVPAITAIFSIIGLVAGLLMIYLIVLLALAPYAVINDNKGSIEGLLVSTKTLSKNIHPVVGTLCIIFSPIIALLYLFPGFRASKLGQTNLIKLISLTYLVVLIGFGIGLLVGILMGILSLIIKGLIGRIMLTVFNSALNAYLGALMTLAFTYFYLAITQKPQVTSEEAPPTSA